MEELLDRARVGAEAARLGRRAPLPPLLIAVVAEEARHDDGQIRAQRAAVLELAQDREIVLDQPQPDVGLELLLLVDGEPVAGSEHGYLLAHEAEIGEQQLARAELLAHRWPTQPAPPRASTLRREDMRAL